MQTKGAPLFQTPQWLKKLRSNKKRENLGIKKENLQFLDQGLHVVTFVNWSFPLEDIMEAVADSSATWFSEYAIHPVGLEWRKRKSYPIIFKVPNSDLLKLLMSEPIHKTVSKMGDEPVAICMGPLWNSQVLCYNGYERFQ